MAEDPFINRFRMAVAHAEAVAEQDRSAALEDLESVMDSLGLAAAERDAIRAYATPERLYQTSQIPSVLQRVRHGEPTS